MYLDGRLPRGKSVWISPRGGRSRILMVSGLGFWWGLGLGYCLPLARIFQGWRVAENGCVALGLA